MKLKEVIKDSFNKDISGLADDTRLMSFEEWDSMAHMFFITKLEEEYALELTGDDVFNMKTVGDIKKVLTEKGKAD